MSERRVAWITGAGRGIGRASAIALAEAGCDVGLTSRTPTELREVADECRAKGARAYEAPADVTSRAQVEAAYRAIAKELDTPAILVASAGVAKSASFLKTTEEFMEMHWRLNVLGVFHATQVALPAMIDARWGRIVNVASIAGKAGAPYIAAYAASKHALLGLTRSLAAEVSTKGVTVNAVCPGYVDTPMTEANLDFLAKTTGLKREDALARTLASAGQSRLIRPEEVATVVRELASDASKLTGQAITIDEKGAQWSPP